MHQFTTDTGEQVNVPESETKVVENNPNYRVLQARVNPGGLLTKVVYNNVRSNPGDIFDSADIDQAVEDLDELEGEHDIPELSNPSGVGGAVVSWRNLRLPAAIMGEKKTTIGGATKQVVRKVVNIGAMLGRLNQNTSIRNHPEILMIATAEHWFDYIRNMDPIDVGAELSAEVTPQEQLAVYHFLKEWEMDPTHRAFRNRVSVGADIDSELAKGQIVYDILTSRGPDPMKSNDYANHRYDKMFRLGMDILSSIRLNIYNYYTLNRMHVQEGDRVFMDFRSRYIALNTEEVEMVKEMETNISTGKSYAFMTTSSETQALEADELMRKAVSSYQVGDTRTTRSILEVLGNIPYNYTPMHTRLRAKHIVEEKTEGEISLPQGEVFKAVIPEDIISGQGEGLAVYLEGNMAFLSIVKGTKTDILDKGKLKKAKAAADKGVELLVLNNYFEKRPVGILKAVKGGGGGGGGRGGGGGAKWVYDDYDTYMKKGVKTFEDAGQRDRKRDLQQSAKGGKKPWKKSWAKKNPKAKGRGKFLFLEIHSKHQLKMKRGTGEQKHGKSANTAKWTKGLNKIFPGTMLVKVGTHKITGVEVPYRIALPISHFKGVTHPKKGYRTIGLKKGGAKVRAVWQKILDEYGMPKHAPVKGTYMRYKIDDAEQGPYYDGHRRRVGKAKS